MWRGKLDSVSVSAHELKKYHILPVLTAIIHFQKFMQKMPFLLLRYTMRWVMLLQISAHVSCQ